ncbi:hypothetical protein [Streptomyces sp. BE303]|uniref:hypothetical protein n=1 Tax=Streptomyces sp. BE303 TaxID=3002528 RepID=UPI002E75EC46|nr:hypothetical protein [Streptomyces sp. BE303]MED7952822.1 hypothetical protein [Streptomyces sp. BE303]
MSGIGIPMAAGGPTGPVTPGWRSPDWPDAQLHDQLPRGRQSGRAGRGGLLGASATACDALDTPASPPGTVAALAVTPAVPAPPTARATAPATEPPATSPTPRPTEPGSTPTPSTPAGGTPPKKPASPSVPATPTRPSAPRTTPPAADAGGGADSPGRHDGSAYDNLSPEGKAAHDTQNCAQIPGKRKGSCNEPHRRCKEHGATATSAAGAALTCRTASWDGRLRCLAAGE